MKTMDCRKISLTSVFKEQLKQMNMIPCGYHRYYYREEEMLEHALEEYQTIGTRAQQVKETEAELFELYKDPELDHKPEQLQNEVVLIIQMLPVKRLLRSMEIKKHRSWYLQRMMELFLICRQIV